MYPSCHSGDIQAINAGSSHKHINLQYKNVEGKERKSDWLQTISTKHKNSACNRDAFYNGEPNSWQL